MPYPSNSTLDQYLSSRYAFSSSKYICEVCEYVAKNQSAMSAHKRGCKPKSTSDNEVILNDVVIQNNIISDIVIEQESLPTQPKKKSKNSIKLTI